MWSKLGLIIMLLVLFIAAGGFGANALTLGFAIGAILYFMY